MAHRGPYPWETYLESITKLNDWEHELFTQIEYDGSPRADEACHLATEIIYQARQLEFDTGGLEKGANPIEFCAELIGKYCNSGHAACSMLETMGANMTGNEAVEVRLRALHGMLRLCKMPGVRGSSTRPEAVLA